MFKLLFEIIGLLTPNDLASQLSHSLFFLVEIESFRIFQLKSTRLKIFSFKISLSQKAFIWFRVWSQFFSDSLDLPLPHGLVKCNHISVRYHTCAPLTTHDDPYRTLAKYATRPITMVAQTPR